MNPVQKQFAPAILVLLFSFQTAPAYYDPAIQRWINRDPLGSLGHGAPSPFKSTTQRPAFAEAEEGTNLYEPVHNDPVNLADSDGLRGAAEPPRGDPKCYTKKDIPKDIYNKLSQKQKDRLDKASFKCFGMTCSFGVLAGGGVIGGPCISCSF